MDEVKAIKAFYFVEIDSENAKLTNEQIIQKDTIPTNEQIIQKTDNDIEPIILDNYSIPYPESKFEYLDGATNYSRIPYSYYVMDFAIKLFLECSSVPKVDSIILIVHYSDSTSERMFVEGLSKGEIKE
jgi:hypothetical protein